MNTSGPIEEGTEVENAAELKFPREFEEADTLLTSEVFLLLEFRRKQLEQEEEITEMSEVFLKCHSYAQRMSKFRNRDTIRTVRQLLSTKPFHKFEMMQLANLCPDTAEEAKALIPSLESKIDDAELDELLSDMHVKRSFQ
ncbi:DNA directed RNA polymerase II subunit RPB4 [Trichuris trichiura]|uniref:DNA directed RNA polymerase II subunit RPB4 n=1 Tax=Trichuris trichiura TaxID=36087 RepID=A0A077Z3C3_TRITR|nr:DNA directed RNA polymerase II subunit RPB4 [Trichuris trichiura]